MASGMPKHVFKKVLCCILNYSQTGCSFDGNLANFRRNLGNLIDSLSGALVATRASKLQPARASWSVH